MPDQFVRERKLFAFNLAVLDGALADVDDDELATHPVAGLNPPRWIVAHLAVVNDSIGQLLGGQPICPPDWHKAFGPGSKPSADGPQPTKAELLAAIHAGHDTMIAQLADADEGLLSSPHSVDIGVLKTVFPTWGDLIANIMSNHMALHLGQLSAWRRILGRPPMF